MPLCHDSKRIGELCLRKGLLTEDQLREAVREKERSRRLFGAILIEKDFLKKEQLDGVLAEQWGLPAADLKKKELSDPLRQLIPAALAARHAIFPVSLTEDILTVAAADPFDSELLETLRLYTGKEIEAVYASLEDIEQAISRCYGVGADTVEQMTPRSRLGQEKLFLQPVESEASVGKVLNQILNKAYQERATDIHFEPGEHSLSVRFRVDGVLKMVSVPKNLWHFREAVNARVKILSRLNIAEKRLPQDGKFKFKTGGTELDLRVSFVPSTFGESLSIRVLNSARYLQLTELGLSPGVLYDLNRMLNKNSGMIFVTGPTGSGKTSTLYAAIHRLDRDSKKIITIEDPPEYQISGITQIQVHPAIGLTFAAGLRSVLRHDPDIILIG